jgi:hypothetical protein
MSPNSSCFIEPCSSHCPFALSHTITYPFFTPFLMQTTHHPPAPPTTLTNHTPPISSPYQPLSLHVNVGSRPNTFLISLNNAHLEPFPPSTLNNAHVHGQIPKHTCNFHLELLALHVDVNLPFEG